MFSCPVNEAIFPGLEEDRVTRKNLVAPFEAFSFPASQVVNFIATVNFCQRRCEPVGVEGSSSQISSMYKIVSGGAGRHYWRLKISCKKRIFNSQYILFQPMYRQDAYPEPVLAETSTPGEEENVQPTRTSLPLSHFLSLPLQS